MKKLIIAATVAFVAVASQAAAITWGALNIKTPAATDPKVAQSGIIGAGETMTGLAVTLYWVSTTGDQLIGTYESANGRIAAQTLGDGVNSDIYKAMVADRGDTWKPQYHFTATYTTADGTYVYDGYSTATKAIGDVANYAIASNANFGNAATGSWTYTPAAIPEPTSGLLLLLGMAGLALRRLRA